MNIYFQSQQNKSHIKQNQLINKQTDQINKMVILNQENIQDYQHQTQQNQEAWNQVHTKINNQDLRIFDNFRPLGNAFFTNEIQKIYNIRLFHHKLINTFHNDYWSIKVKSEKEKIRLQLIFSIMLESQTLTFQIQGFPMPNILKTISNIKFHQLTKLNLYKCGIVNIQPLTFIDAPNLKTLSLIYNYVYEYKSLNKTNFQLEKLFIYVRSEEDIKKAKFNIRIDDSSRWNFNLQNLRLEKHIYNKIIMEDLSFLSKLQRNRKYFLDTNISMNTKRILQRKLYEKYFNQTKIRLFLFDIYDDQREFPVDRYMTLKNCHAFHIQRTY